MTSLVDEQYILSNFNVTDIVTMSNSKFYVSMNNCISYINGTIKITWLFGIIILCLFVYILYLYQKIYKLKKQLKD